MDSRRSCGLLGHRTDPGRRRRSLEVGDSLQRVASQPLGITRDVTLALAFDVGHSTIEGSNKLAKIVDEGLV
jgi:hypothetical protein